MCIKEAQMNTNYDISVLKTAPFDDRSLSITATTFGLKTISTSMKFSFCEPMVITPLTIKSELKKDEKKTHTLSQSEI